MFSRKSLARHTGWFIIMLAALALLIWGIVKESLKPADTSRRPAGVVRHVPVSGSQGKKEENIAGKANGDMVRGPKTELPSVHSSLSSKPAIEVGHEHPTTSKEGPYVGVDMSGPPKYPEIAAGILEWAKTKSVEELVRLIEENYFPPTASSEEEGDEEGDRPWENDISLKASWALALKLRDDPTLLEQVRAAFLNRTLRADAAGRLVEIVALVPHDEATALLLCLVKLEPPVAPFWQIVRALHGRTGLRDLPPIEDYVAELAYLEPSERFGFPWITPADGELPPLSVVETFLSLLGSHVGVSNDWDRFGPLLEAFRDILKVYRNLRAKGRDKEPQMFEYCQKILDQAGWLANNSDNSQIRKAAFEVLSAFPQGPQPWETILAALRDPAWDVRCQALSSALEYRTVPEVESIVIEMARNDPVRQVRYFAIRNLSKDGATGQIKLQLATAWYSPDAHFVTRREAIKLLGGCGLPALPQLERIAAEDSDPELRAYALQKIEEVKRREEREERMRKQAEFLERLKQRENRGK